MRDLALDFQPRRPGLLMVVLLLAGVMLCADAWLEYGALDDRLAETESRLAQAQKRADRAAASKRDSRPENIFSPEEAAALRQAFAAMRIDWERLFVAIDVATSEEIALLAVRPSVSGKSLQIAGEARNMAAALAFVESLRQAPLANVALVSHQVRDNDPQRPIAFEISATWITGS